MSMLVLVAAICIVLGVLFLAWEALRTRPLSHFHRPSGSKPTLEPEGQGLRFLGPARNWAGLALISAGIIIFVATI